jgi:GTP-binding protein EngB required for normal cell division
MDIRRDWTEDEDDILRWLLPRQLPAAAICTKTDKLSRSEMLNRQRLIRKQSGLENVLTTSSIDKSGYEEVENFVFDAWVSKARG